MGKQRKMNKKRQQHHHHHPERPAAIAVPQEMEEAPVSPYSGASPDDAAPQKTAAAGEGKKVPGELKPASNGEGHPSPAWVTLNGMLAKQMLEARQERDQDQDQDQAILSEIERAAIGGALASQLSQEAGRLTREAGERGHAEGADAAGREAAREMEERLAATESRWMDVLAEMEKKKTAVCEESARLKRDLRELAQDKAEVEKNLRAAATEADAIRGSLQDAKKALERAQEENQKFSKDLQGFVLERDEAQKYVDAQTRERKALEIKISDLERRHEEARRALDRTVSTCKALEGESKEKAAALELSTQDKATLEKSLAESLQMVEDLRRQVGEAILAKDEEVKKVLLERDEVRQSLHLQIQGMKDVAVRAREVASEVVGRAPGETADEWGRDLELLMEEAASEESVLADVLRLLNKLSGGMAKAIQAKGEELEQTKAEMERMISMKEEEFAEQAKANFSLNSVLASLRWEHESLKAEEEGLRFRVAKLSASNGHAQKVLEAVRGELGGKVEEEEENTRRYHSLVEGYVHRIEDLTKKLEAAAEEREKMEKATGKQKGEIFLFQGAIARLNSEIAALKELCSIRAQENEALRAEKDGVQERLGQQTQVADEIFVFQGVIAQLSSEKAALQELSSIRAQENEELRAEKDGVLERLGQQTHQAEALVLELEEVKKSKSAMERELGALQRANARLLDEKQQMERQADALGEENAAAEGRLENTEKAVEVLQKLAARALSMMKSAAAEAARGLGAGDNGAVQGEGEEEEEEVLVVGDVRPFEEAMEAIRKAVRRRREAEVEGMKRELERQRESVEEPIRRALRRREAEVERQRESVEGVQRANSRWKWLFSAVAAVSTTALAWAFAARVR